MKSVLPVTLADTDRAKALLGGLEFLVVQDLFLTKTAELADVVLPAAAAWAESEGTVTNSERRPFTHTYGVDQML